MNWNRLTGAALAVLAALTIPASAAEITVEAPVDGDFGTPSSVTAVQTPNGGAAVNTDRSKNAAMIPPGFGTPTADLPGSGEYLTPNLAPGGMPATGVTINGGAGAVIIPGSAIAPSQTNQPSRSDTGYTEVTDDLYYAGGYLGTLKIPAIDLSVKIYQGTGSSTLKKGAGHFTDTSIWDGNVCLAAHNRGTNSYFGQIHTLDAGDKITLTTRLGTRTYRVTSVAKISETDDSSTAPTADNCVTLYTCVRDQRDYRWCVRAVEDV